ncbi:MAG: hypothetical protein QGI21_04810 [Candidatus Poseidoniaceae archaeon]|nr:hypothetical protein [Candidatus Poseidoniaceae archaeon]
MVIRYKSSGSVVSSTHPLYVEFVVEVNVTLDAEVFPASPPEPPSF